MTASTIYATLGGLTFDGSTPDADGTIWCLDFIDGWWGSAPLDTARATAPIGDYVTANRMKGRALTLEGSATVDGVGHRALGTLRWAKAQRTLLRSMRFEYIPGTLVVVDPEFSLQAQVRRVDQEIRTAMHGKARVLSFQVPLLAADPRKYSSTITTDTQLSLGGTSDSATIVNLGDQPTDPIITLTQTGGSSVNPAVINDSEALGLFYTGTLSGGDVLVLDCGARTAELNGVDVIPALDHFSPPSVFWNLQPGNNSCRLLRSSGSGTLSCSVAYRYAYS